MSYSFMSKTFNIIMCWFFFQALESFLLRCPRDIGTYCDDILSVTLEYLSYDPNFTDNMEEDTDNEGHEEEEDEYVLEYLFIHYKLLFKYTGLFFKINLCTYSYS